MLSERDDAIERLPPVPIGRSQEALMNFQRCALVL